MADFQKSSISRLFNGTNVPVMCIRVCNFLTKFCKTHLQAYSNQKIFGSLSLAMRERANKRKREGKGKGAGREKDKGKEEGRKCKNKG
jgi:hypothetical protein